MLFFVSMGHPLPIAWANVPFLTVSMLNLQTHDQKRLAVISKTSK
jgi:hypothetical protein